MIQPNFFSAKISDTATKAINKLMLISGAIAIGWILLFLLVALIER